MGSRKLLLKQKEVAEAFASWRDQELMNRHGEKER